MTAGENGLAFAWGKWSLRTTGVLGLLALFVLVQAVTLALVVWYVMDGFADIRVAHAAVDRAHVAQGKSIALLACMVSLSESRRAALVQATTPEAIYIFCPLLRVLE